MRANAYRLQLEAALRRLPPGSAFSGYTALWLHGLQVEPCNPIEVTVPARAPISTRAGMVVRRRALGPRDVLTVRGMPCTSILWTIRDLCLRLSLTEAVVVADMAMHAGLVGLEALTECAQSRTYGVRMLRQVMAHVDPAAESAMETRLRVLLVLGGLPRPAVQFTVRDHLNRTIARPDLYYPEQKLGLEYDGATHDGTLAEDNRRQNRLLDAGIRLLRFTAGDIYQRPEAVIALVRSGLAA